MIIGLFWHCKKTKVWFLFETYIKLVKNVAVLIGLRKIVLMSCFEDVREYLTYYSHENEHCHHMPQLLWMFVLDRWRNYNTCVHIFTHAYMHTLARTQKGADTRWMFHATEHGAVLNVFWCSSVYSQWHCCLRGIPCNWTLALDKWNTKVNINDQALITWAFWIGTAVVAFRLVRDGKCWRILFLLITCQLNIMTKPHRQISK